MQTVDRKFGQQFLLARAATRLRRFTISELHRATDVPENTIYSFVSRLIHRGNLETEELTSAGAGRPRKRYSLTDAGLDYLLRRNALVVSLLQGERDYADNAHHSSSDCSCGPEHFKRRNLV